MSKTIWKEEIENISNILSTGKTIEEVGKVYSVSKQRIYQVMEKFGLETINRKKKNFLRDKEIKYYWLNRILVNKKFSKIERRELLESMDVPDICPMLGVELNYNGTGVEGWGSKKENSPSLDRIDSSKGYVKDNIQVISWRANRIKNDSTPEELIKIATYMLKLTNNKLHV